MPLDREVVTYLLDQLLTNAFKFTLPGVYRAQTSPR